MSGSGSGAPTDVFDSCAKTLAALEQRGATVAVAESLTGGGLGAALTAVPGASRAFRGGVIAYATDAKARVLGVDPDLLAQRGAVDAEVAAQMAVGVRALLAADYGVALTGVAGPEPQDGQEPGTVFVGVTGPAGVETVRLRLEGDRETVRGAAIAGAVAQLREVLAQLD